MDKLRASDFAKFLGEAEARKDGYILCTAGEDPKKLSDWYFSGQYSGKQLEKALYWRENAERVYDCNGLLEAFYRDKTGYDLNKDDQFNKAYKTYENACSKKGKGAIPEGFKKTGAAVFMHSDGLIRHIGFLEKPNGDDWDVIEARGVNYGVVRTKLSKRAWTHWGLVDKLLTYEDAETAYRTQYVHLSDPLDFLAVRSRPDFNAPLVAKLRHGASVRRVGTDGKWARIDIGYCWASNLKDEKPDAVRYILKIEDQLNELVVLQAAHGGKIEVVQ